MVDNLSQEQQSFKFFELSVGFRYFYDDSYLIIKLITDAFDSDPDLFISKKNKYPKDSAGSDWSCQKKGSETCIL